MGWFHIGYSQLQSHMNSVGTISFLGRQTGKQRTSSLSGQGGVTRWKRLSVAVRNALRQEVQCGFQLVDSPEKPAQITETINIWTRACSLLSKYGEMITQLNINS